MQFRNTGTAFSFSAKNWNRSCSSLLNRLLLVTKSVITHFLWRNCSVNANVAKNQIAFTNFSFACNFPNVANMLADGDQKWTIQVFIQAKLCCKLVSVGLIFHQSRRQTDLLDLDHRSPHRAADRMSKRILYICDFCSNPPPQKKKHGKDQAVPLWCPHGWIWFSNAFTKKSSGQQGQYKLCGPKENRAWLQHKWVSRFLRKQT